MVVLVVGCLGFFGLTGIGLIIAALVPGEQPVDLNLFWDRNYERYLWVGLGIPLVGIVGCIVVASKINATTNAIVDRAERFRRGERGVFRTVFARPLTAEHKKLYDAVALMANNLEKREAELERIADVYVHDLNNELTKAEGTLNNLRDYESRMSEDDKRKRIVKVEKTIQNIGQIIERLDKETERARTQEEFFVDLSKLTEALQNHYPENELEIQGLDTPAPVKVGLSEIMLETILLSVIGNAHKHGGTDVRVSLDFNAYSAPTHGLEIKVSDTGLGISENIKDSIFELGFSTQPNGTTGGMGLPAANNLLELHGGSIELLPSEKGASFLIKIPLFEQVTSGTWDDGDNSEWRQDSGRLYLTRQWAKTLRGWMGWRFPLGTFVIVVLVVLMFAFFSLPHWGFATGW